MAAFWEAMLKAVELTSDEAKLGELYGELSWESTMRGAMWKVAPDDAIARGWMTQALEFALPDSRSHGYALTAKAMREDDVSAADRAVAIAERLDDVELLSFGLFVHSAIAEGRPTRRCLRVGGTAARLAHRQRSRPSH